MLMLACRAVAARRRVFVIALHNPTAGLVTPKSCNRATTASCIQTLCNTEKEILRRTFNENIDLSGASKPFARVETHQDGLASSQNIARVEGDFLLQTSGAQ